MLFETKFSGEKVITAIGSLIKLRSVPSAHNELLSQAKYLRFSSCYVLHTALSHVFTKKLQVEISNVFYLCFYAENIRTIPLAHIYIMKHYEKKIAADPKQKLQAINPSFERIFSRTPNEKFVVDFL